ncbi:MAG: 30S ribosomal protein S3 [Candidatus Omnitrophica bacterium]|nr:30S ribosomal protein S3 [Candidatus Omnitrophota bacterium]
MGQKVHPYGLRLGIIKNWKSQWFADKRSYTGFLHEDLKIRKFIKKALSQAAVSDIEIERASSRIRVRIHSARPGVIIGRRGAEIDKLKEELRGITQKEILIDISEVKNPNLSSQLVAENIAFQIEKRIPVRRAMKKAIQTAMNSGAGGIKVLCSGRLGGAEIARREGYKEGKVPLHTLRADIDYGFAEALTTYGLIGVKVWIYKGEIIPKSRRRDPVPSKVAKPAVEEQGRPVTSVKEEKAQDGVDAQKG